MRRTVLTCYLVVVCASWPSGAVWADAPERKVWSDAPKKSDPSKIGPRNLAVELNRYEQVRYASQKTGSDASGNGSADKPWRSISHALRQITEAGPSKRCAILVGPGTYAGQTIRMKEHVDLYGGFEPGNWRRDIFVNRSILDGKHTRRVVEAANNARLDGFVITAGKSPGHGGGVLCHRTSPVITNNFITGNTTLEPVGFVHNPDRRRHVGNDGGGIACVDGANPLIAHNIIHGNTTEVGNGAGIACRDDACPKIVYNVIWTNKTGLKDTRDTRSSNGGGISCFAGARPIISNNLIANNSASGGSDGGAVYCEYNCSPDVSFNFVLGNRSDDDGGGFEIMKSSQPNIHRNVIIGNQTGGGGGAIRLSDQGLARITNNVIARNQASKKGGGVACTNAWMVLESNTIIDNTSKRAGGVIYYNEDWPHLAPPIITRNTIWGNGDKQLDAASNNARIEFNNIEAGYPGKGNTATNPGFADDGLRQTAHAPSYDYNRFVTTLSVQDQKLNETVIVGRVVRVGNTWTVVKSAARGELIVWGDLSSAKPEFEILGSYCSPR
jgi:hypothetical protein